MKSLLCVIGLAVFCCRIATAEVVTSTYKSPDGKWVVQVTRTSEAPDFRVTLKQDDKIFWSFHPDPRDKIVRIFWHPDSSEFLMEYVNRQNDYRLYVISVSERHPKRFDHIKMFPIAIEHGIRPSSIVDGTVAWDIQDGSDWVIKLTMEDEDSKKREMRIIEWRELRYETVK